MPMKCEIEMPELFWMICNGEIASRVAEQELRAATEATLVD